jgi:hypothetical protein
MSHLYKLKKTCPGILHDVELTDEIKESIMTNRKYTPTQSFEITQQNNMHINQTINNYNTMNNYIANLDTFLKISKLAEYQNIELVDFETRVEELYRENVSKLEKGSYKSYEIDTSGLLQIIDEISTVDGCLQKDIENFNIVYDKERNKLLFWDGRRWEGFLVESGIHNLLRTVCTYYLYSMEVFLIRKIEVDKGSLHKKTQLKECLMHYYTLLACFHVDPFIKNRNDHQILYNPDDERYNEKTEEFSLVDKYMSLYNKANEQLTRAQENRLKKDVLEIIKKNSNSNIKQLNKCIINLIQIDTEFQNKMFEEK